MGPLFVFPSKDIHLLEGEGDVDLRFFGRLKNGTWTDLGALPSGKLPITSAQPYPGTPVAANHAWIALHGLRLQPNDVGTTFFRIELQTVNLLDVLESFIGLVRVSLHRNITSIWAGNNQVTLFEDEANYILSVYAQFDDDSVGDITGHPYIQYQPLGPAPGVVVQADGRVHATARGNYQVRIQAPGVAPVDVDVIVEPPMNERLEPEVDVLLLRGNRPIFIVAEGYTDRARFFEHSRQIVDRWFSKRAHSPFLHLKDSFEVWRVWDPTTEGGITCGLGVENRELHVGSKVHQLRNYPFPLSPEAANDLGIAHTNPQQIPAGYRLLQARDSRFGILYASRLAGNQTVAGPPIMTPPPGPEAAWLRPIVEHRVPTVDFRRIPPDLLDPHEAYSDYLARYLNTIGIPDLDPENARVVFLIDDHHYGGLWLGVASRVLVAPHAVTASVGREVRFFIDVNDPVADRVDEEVTFHLEPITALVSHEVAHTFDLGDEYERLTRAPPRNQAQREIIEALENVTSDRTINNAGQLRAGQPKWDLRRISAASPVIGVAQQGPQVKVSLEPSELGKWIRGDRVRLRTTFALDRSPVSQPPRILESPELHISRKDPDGVVCTPRGAVNVNDFAAEAILFRPVPRPGGLDPRLIQEEVRDYLAGLPNRLSFERPEGCNTIVTGTQHPDSDIPGFLPPRNDWQTIGIYEGGGTFTCEVYRPAGNCKMRGEFVDEKDVGFCFVCKYIIVDKIDPTKHGDLDREYP